MMDARGYNQAHLNGCDYSLGAVFLPIWIDKPMLYRGNPITTEPDMAFSPHMIPMDNGPGLAMCPVETVIGTETDNESLFKASLDPVMIS